MVKQYQRLDKRLRRIKAGFVRERLRRIVIDKFEII